MGFTIWEKMHLCYLRRQRLKMWQWSGVVGLVVVTLARNGGDWGLRHRICSSHWFNALLHLVANVISKLEKHEGMLSSLQWRILGGAPWPKIFSIACSFFENLAKSYVSAPARKVSTYSYGEFWICPYLGDENVTVMRCLQWSSVMTVT